MHDLLVADALRPAPTTILNLPLLEYSLGHELLLLSRRNALALSTRESFIKMEFWEQLYFLREAVWICSDLFSERNRFEQPGILMLGFRWNEWKRRRWVRGQKHFEPIEYGLAEAEFRNYLTAAHPEIPCAGKHAVDVLYGDDAATGRHFGQPTVLSLYNFVLTLPAEERPECAWDYPFAKAMWLFFAKLEADGNYRIENAEEREEQAVLDDARAEAKARAKPPATVAAGPESVPEKSVSPDTQGLATPPPNLEGWA